MNEIRVSCQKEFDKIKDQEERGKVHYEIGKPVECPDWLDDWKEECGHALHCSPHVFLTDRYANGREHIHVAVEVAVKDIRLPKFFTMPDKIRVRKVKVLEQIAEA